MSLRFSINEALEKGLIDADQARGFRRVARQALAERGGRGKGRGAAAGAALCPIEGSTPQEKLWRGVCTRWPRRAQWEYPGAIPGRRYRLDIAFPEEKLVIEVDGWEFHGKHLADFKRDREKQNLLTLHGWRILRFTAAEINGALETCLATIAQALQADDAMMDP